MRATLALSCLCCVASACGPVTGGGGIGPLLSPRGVSEGQEIRIGQRASRESSRVVGLVADQSLQDYVQQIGAQLAETSERSQLPWTFRVLDDAMPNAFALPGGFVFVTRGLLAVANSEAELASVLAHEIAHVSARHALQGLTRPSGPDLGVWAVPVAELRALDGAATGGPGLLFTGYTADAEREADALGSRYLLAAGYEAREAGGLLSALGRLEVVGGRSALPPWLASHPEAEDAGRRTESIQEPLDSLRQHRVEYLEHIEDLVYGQDPRQGFFRGTAFIHPELRFRLQLPSGWRYRHLAQAVVATSADRNAAIQVTIADESSLTEVADRFLGQSGVSAIGQPATETVAGNPALSVPFRVSTAAGSGSGSAAWVSYGGRTYQIVSIAATDAANGHAEAFREVVRSFGPVTEARLLDVKPNRINIVRLGRATTFEDFNRRYPSAIEAEEVALLNRVSGPGARLRAGGRVKRVVKG
jgi:predicted Zn-dependent protease